MPTTYQHRGRSGARATQRTTQGFLEQSAIGPTVAHTVGTDKVSDFRALMDMVSDFQALMDMVSDFRALMDMVSDFRALMDMVSDFRALSAPESLCSLRGQVRGMNRTPDPVIGEVPMSTRVLGFRVSVFGFGVSGVGSLVSGFWFPVFVFRVSCFAFRV